MTHHSEPASVKYVYVCVFVCGYIIDWERLGDYVFSAQRVAFVIITVMYMHTYGIWFVNGHMIFTECGVFPYMDNDTAA